MIRWPAILSRKGAPPAPGGDLILHMGVHKTGSSAIQSWLLAKTPALRDKGVIFPAELFPHSGNGAHVAYAMMGDDDPSGAADYIASLMRDNPGADLILSAEDFSNRLLRAVAGLKMARGDELQRLTGYIDSLAPARRIAVLFLRNDIDKENSGYAQRVKTMRVFKRPGIFTGTGNQYFFDWADLFTALEQAGFEVRASVFPPRDGTPISETLMRLSGHYDRLGADFGYGDVTVSNLSIGMAGALVAEFLARQALDDAEQPKPGVDFDRLTALVYNALDGLPDKPFNGFAPDVLRARNAEYTKRYARLERWIGADGVACLSTPRTDPDNRPVTAIEDLPGDLKHTAITALDRLAKSLATTRADHPWLTPETETAFARRLSALRMTEDT